MAAKHAAWAGLFAVAALGGALAGQQTGRAPTVFQDVTISPTGELAADQGGAKPKGLPAGASSCGSERADVKHLTDGVVLPTLPTVSSIEQLVNLSAPAVAANSPRFTSVPAGSMPETALLELRGVHVIAAKQEADSDLHIIIAGAAGGEMNVESPAAACDASSPYAADLARARAAIDAALGQVSTTGYTPENLVATIAGPVFWDVLHGQRGAPNGVELHPVTFFSAGGAPVPTLPTTTAVTTVPRDADYKADAKECGLSLRGDRDRREDGKECGR